VNSSCCSSVALVGVGVLGIIYAALSLALRLPGIRSFHHSIVAMGSASGLRAVGIFLFVVLLIGGSRRRRDEPFITGTSPSTRWSGWRGVSPCDQRANAGRAGAASPGGRPS
jgi:hypothetical protein